MPGLFAVKSSHPFSPAIDPANPPTFEEIFSRPDARDLVVSVVTLEGNTYREVDLTETASPARGYWVLAGRDIPFVDPMRVVPRSARFTESAPLQQLVIDVIPGPARTLTLAVTGERTIDWLEVATRPGEFSALRNELSIAVAEDATSLTLLLRANRSENANGEPRPEEARLDITDGDGNRATAALRLEPPRVDGVWVGTASIDEVTTIDALGGNFAPVAAMEFSLILELPEGTDAPRLLDHVVRSVDRDGRVLRQRLSSLGVRAPVELAGSLSPRGDGGVLTGRTTIAADAPLNPYRHRYHPEHTEGWTIEREIRLRFSDDDANPSALGQVGGLRGRFEETITGLAATPIRTRGSFRLQRLGDLSELERP